MYTFQTNKRPIQAVLSLDKRKSSYENSQKQQHPTNPTTVVCYQHSSPRSQHEVQPFFQIQEDINQEILKRRDVINELQLQLTTKNARYRQMLINLNHRFQAYRSQYRFQSQQLQRLGEVIRCYQGLKKR